MWRWTYATFQGWWLFFVGRTPGSNLLGRCGGSAAWKLGNGCPGLLRCGVRFNFCISHQCKIPRVFVSHLPALEHADVNFNVSLLDEVVRVVDIGTDGEHCSLQRSSWAFVLLMSLSTVLSKCLHLFDQRRLARTMPVPVLRSPRGCAPLVVAPRPGWRMRVRLFKILTIVDVCMFTHQVTQYCTPHSSRTFLLNSTAAPEFDVAERTVLGGCAAQHIDRYARGRNSKSANMQEAVLRSIWDARGTDPLDESEPGLPCQAEDGRGGRHWTLDKAATMEFPGYSSQPWIARKSLTRATRPPS